jgi:hypothetical protein
MTTISAEPTASPHLVELPRRICLVADGSGGPHSSDFQKAMEAVYAVAVTLKLQLAIEGRNFELEPPAVIWSCPAAPFEATPGENGWSWKIVCPVPADVDGQLVKLIKDSLVSRRHLDFAADARIEEEDADVCAEMVHVGPYDRLGETLGTLHAYLIEAHLLPRGPHQEIYLDDPRITSPEHVRTLIRQPVG